MCQESVRSCSHAATSADRSLFVAVDGVTGLTWTGLSAAQVAAALALTEGDLAVVRAEPGVVPVVVPVRHGATEVLFTTGDGQVGFFEGQEPQASRLVVAGSGAAAAGLVSAVVALLGVPERVDSDAAA